MEGHVEERKNSDKEFLKLKNVGKACLKDLHLLEIHSIEQLAQQDPTELFHRLETLTKQRQDPCVWDVFAAIIHQARTGEALVWWSWTPHRKALIAKGQLDLKRS